MTVMLQSTLLCREGTKELLPAILAAAAGWPVAAALRHRVADHRHDSLIDLARLSGQMSTRSDTAVGKEFVDAMSTAYTALVNEAIWPRYQGTLDKVARAIPVETFNNSDVITLEPPPFLEVREDAEPIFGNFTATKVTGKLRTFESVCTISRSVWSTLGEALSSSIAAVLVKLYALELQLAAECLGTIAFDASNSTSGALSTATLDAAMGFLEEQGLKPAALLLAPKKGATAAKVVRDSGLELDLITMPDLAAGSWYLIPSPTERAVLVRLFLRSDFIQGLTQPSISWTKVSPQIYGLYIPRDIGYVSIHSDAVYRGGV
jgi:hypothetical protein